MLISPVGEPRSDNVVTGRLAEAPGVVNGRRQRMPSTGAAGPTGRALGVDSLRRNRTYVHVW